MPRSASRPSARRSTGTTTSITPRTVPRSRTPSTIGCGRILPQPIVLGVRDLGTVLGVIEVVVPVDRLAEGLDALRGIGGLRHDGIQDSTGIDCVLGPSGPA